MKKLSNNLKFILALIACFAVLTACNKKSETTSDSKDTKKEETKKEDTKKTETTSSTTDNSSSGSGSAKLYFVEDYKDGKEINKSEKFSPGWLTVMVDLRPTGKTLGVGKVELRIVKTRDSDGDKISEKIIDTVPFDVQADWDYTFFKDKDKIGFKTPGTYKVTMQKVDGTPICSGEVEIVK
ncbi:hypothetical protein BH10BAC5_BH10BAC5_00140 [soil metagenome]